MVQTNRRCIENYQQQMEDAENKDMRIFKWESPPDDTAAWLYRLIFGDSIIPGTGKHTIVGTI
jgi:hypothetical protein